MPKFLPVAYLQDQFLPFSQANISIATHALHYGTAAFGGLRVHVQDGRAYFFRLSDHSRRLSMSAKILGYELSAAKIEKLLVEFVLANKPEHSFYIRPLVYTSDLDIAPRLHNMQKDFLIYGLELGDYLSASGVKCCFSSWVRQNDNSLPLRGKISGAYITSALAKSEAVERGFDEAILLNSAGKVSEATGMNIFAFRDGQIITPSADQDILEGITRRSVIEVLQNLGYRVVERPVDKSELLIAEEVFLTGTAARIASINQIENYHLPEAKPIAEILKKLFTQIQSGKNEQYSDWITVLDL